MLYTILIHNGDLLHGCVRNICVCVCVCLSLSLCVCVCVCVCVYIYILIPGRSLAVLIAKNINVLQYYFQKYIPKQFYSIICKNIFRKKVLQYYLEKYIPKRFYSIICKNIFRNSFIVLFAQIYSETILQYYL